MVRLNVNTSNLGSSVFENSETVLDIVTEDIPSALTGTMSDVIYRDYKLHHLSVDEEERLLVPTLM